LVRASADGECPGGSGIARTSGRRITDAFAATALALDEALANLQKFGHLVVPMLENRSFDHTLASSRSRRARPRSMACGS